MGQSCDCGMGPLSLIWCPVFLLKVDSVSSLFRLSGILSKVPPFESWESLTSLVSGAFWRIPQPPMSWGCPFPFFLMALRTFPPSNTISGPSPHYLPQPHAFSLPVPSFPPSRLWLLLLPPKRDWALYLVDLLKFFFFFLTSIYWRIDDMHILLGLSYVTEDDIFYIHPSPCKTQEDIKV